MLSATIPEIVSFGLQNDTDMPGDLITADPTLQGVVDYGGGFYDVAVEVDIDADGMVDGWAGVMGDGSFTFDPQAYLMQGSSVTIDARAVDNMGMVEGDWVSLTFTFDGSAGEVPQVASLSLVNDTGIPGDFVTQDPQLTGQVDYSGDPMMLSLEVDVGNDGSIEDWVSVGADGSFYYDASMYLTPGVSQTVSFRATDSMAMATGDWTSITFTFEQGPAGSGLEINNLGLINDTGTPGDFITDDATLAGMVNYGGDLMGVIVEYDIGADGTVEGATTVDWQGSFTIDPSGYLAPGVATTIELRPVDQMLMLNGDAQTITITYGEPVAEPSPMAVQNLRLANDTGTAGDFISEDVVLTAEVYTEFDLTMAVVELDVNGDGSVEATTTPDLATGTFTFDLLNQLTPSTPTTVKVRAVDDMNMVDSGWYTVTVTYQIGGPSNNAPNAVDDSATVTAGAAVLIDLLGNDSDPDGDNFSIVTIPATTTLGSVINHGDGTITFTANANAADAGTTVDSFTYTLEDEHGATSQATVDVTISPAAPSGGNLTFSIDAGTSFSVGAAAGVLAGVNFSTVTTYSATVAGSPGNGSLLFNSNGSFIYSPNQGFTGTDSFDYEILDDGQMTAGGTIFLQVATLNSVAESYTTGRNTVLFAGELFVTEETPVLPDGLLANDQFGTDGGSRAELVSGTANGMVVVYFDGSFGYIPDTNFVGTDSFSYRLVSGDAQSSPATVTIDVMNAIPIATADNYEVLHDQTLSVLGLVEPDPEDEYQPIMGVLNNDADGDDDFLRAELVSGTTHGVLTFNSLGQFIYTPAAGFAGADSFSYRVTDGVADSTPVTVTIDVINTAPIAVDDLFTTAHDTPIVGTVEEAEADPEHPEITEIFVLPTVLDNDYEPDDEPMTAELIVGTSQGTLHWSGDGTFAYTPDEGFVGTDSFTYRLSDGVSVSNTATVTIQVTNDAPIANDDAYELVHDRRIIGGLNGFLTPDERAEIDYWQFGDDLLDNDVNADEDRITVILETDVLNGTLVLNTNGTFTYTPDNGFTGTDSFAYRLSDGAETSNAATVTFTVTNQAPSAVDDVYTIGVNERVNGGYSFGDPDEDADVQDPRMQVGLTLNDSDADGDAFSLSLVTLPTNGTVVAQSDGTFAYLPSEDFLGTDTFTYELSDGIDVSPPATVTIQVLNETPVVGDDTYTILHDEHIRAGTGYFSTKPGLLVNDSDPDGPLIMAILVDEPTNGTLTWYADGSFDYRPDSAFVGTDFFTYKLSDSYTESTVATVTINVTNAVPIGVADSFSVANDQVLNVNPLSGIAGGLLANDSDADEEILSATLIDGPDHGTIEGWLNNGTFNYIPDPSFEGTDTFTYQANDGISSSAPVTVTINVGAASGSTAVSTPEADAANEAHRQAIADFEDTVIAADAAATAASEVFGSEYAAAQAEWQISVAAAEVEYEEAVEQVDFTYFQGVAQVNAALNASAQQHDATYAAAVAASNTEFLSRISNSQDTYSAEVDALVDVYDSTVAAADTELSSAASAAADDYQAAAAAADTAYTTAVAAADANAASALQTAGDTYQAEEEPAWDDYQSGTSSSQSTYQSAQSTARLTLDAVLDAHPGVVYNPGVADSDPSFLATVASADQTLAAAVTAASDDFNADIDDATETFATTMLAADAAYTQAIAAAGVNYGAAVDQAENTFDSAAQAADSAHAAAIATANTAKLNSIDAAQAAYDQAVAAAQAELTSAQAAAQATYDQTVTAASDAFGDAKGQLTQTYNTQAAALQANHLSTKAQAEATYAATMADLEANFQSVKLTAELAYETAIIGARLTRGAAYFAAEAAYTATVTPIFLAQTALDLLYWDLEILEDAYRTATKQNSVWVAGAEASRKTAEANASYDFIVVERAAASVLATAVAGPSLAKANGEADAAYAKANTLADSLKQFTDAAANLDSQYVSDTEQEYLEFMQATADAKKVQDYANAAAQTALAKAVAAAQYDLETATADAEETYTNAEASAWQTQEIAYANAEEQLANDLAEAEADKVAEEASAGKAYAYAEADAVATFTITVLNDWKDYVAEVSTALLAHTTVVSAARAAAITNAADGDPDVMAVAQAWSAYEISQAFQWKMKADQDAAVAVIYGTAEANARKDMEHTAADIAEAHANEVAAAGVAWVAAEAAAAKAHTIASAAANVAWVQTNAAAAKSFAYGEAASAQTKSDQDADDEELQAREEADQYRDRTYNHYADLRDSAVDQANYEASRAKGRVAAKVDELKKVATSDKSRMKSEAAARKTQVLSSIPSDEALAIENAGKKKTDTIAGAYAAVVQTQNADLEYFADGIFSVAADSWLLNDGLDAAANFFAGWADVMTFGYHGSLRDFLGVNTHIDANSAAYVGGSVVGGVHSFILGVAAGSASHVGWAYSAARWHAAAGTITGMIESGPKIYNHLTGQGEASIWDYLNMLPAAGFVVGRVTNGLGIFRCFVGDTPVAVGWKVEPIIVAADVEQAVNEEAGGVWFIAGVGLVVLSGLGQRIARKRDEKNQNGENVQPQANHLKRRPSSFSSDNDNSVDRVFEETAGGLVAVLDEPHIAPQRRIAQPAATSEVAETMPTADNHNQETSSMSVRNSSSNPTSSQSRNQTGWRQLLWLLPLLMAGVCFWKSLPSGTLTSVAEQSAAASATVPSASQRSLATVAIKDLRTGMRVLADNPELAGLDVPFVQIDDPEKWRNYQLKLEKADGSHVEISLLNPVDWLEEFSSDGGKTVELELHEQGAAGRAEVLAIEPCPKIEPDDGIDRPLITGTFKHTSGKVLDLQSEGEPAVIGTTSNHPFWSEDRQAYVAAGELRIGEQLLTASGRIARLQGVTPRAGTHTVYNLQVDGEHVYYVGETGILVHNSYHVANFVHRNSNGRVLRTGQVRSGGTRPGRRLSFDEQRTLHTERKILDGLDQIDGLKQGHSIEIYGTLPPCKWCSDAMDLTAQESGVIIRYIWNGFEEIFTP